MYEQISIIHHILQMNKSMGVDCLVCWATLHGSSSRRGTVDGCSCSCVVGTLFLLILLLVGCSHNYFYYSFIYFILLLISFVIPVITILTIHTYSLSSQLSFLISLYLSTFTYIVSFHIFNQYL